MTLLTVGIGVSNGTLVFHIHPTGEEGRVVNTRAGFANLLKLLDNRAISRLSFEATGTYHRDFEQAMGQTGLPLCKINPRNAKRLSEAVGQLAETERMGAAMLARFGTLVEPPMPPAPAQVLCDLNAVNIACIALIKDRTAAKNWEKSLASALLKRQSRERLTQIERHLRAMEAEMRERIEADDAPARKFAILTSISGLAARSAFGLIADMPERAAGRLRRPLPG